MKSKRALFVFGGFLFYCVLFAPLIRIALHPRSLVSDQIATLSFTGNDFTCEWVSDDGKSVVFRSDVSRRSIIEFDRPQRFLVGKIYHVKKYPPAHRLGVYQYCLEKS